MRIIRIYVAAILLSVCAMVSNGANSNAADIIATADKAYSDEQYEEAIMLYNRVLDSIGVSADVYYNLGNAYFRVDNIGAAVLNYERALKLDPTDGDARFNLEFVNEKYNLKSQAKSSTSKFVDNLVGGLKPDTWALLSIVAFTLMLGCIGMYFLGHKSRTKKIGFFCGFIMIAVVISTVWIAISSYRRATSSDRCVVMVPSAQLSTVPAVPRTPSQQAFTVPEGFVLNIVDSVEAPLDNDTDVWYLVEVGDDNRAYISNNDVEII